MNVAPAFPLAALMGLPPRKKSKTVARLKTRDRERRTAAAAPKARAMSRRREARNVTRLHVTAAHTPTFAELLEVVEPAPRAPKHSPLSLALTREKAPPSRKGMTAAARKIIALGAAARGETAPPDDIEAQLRRERDEACRITPAARAVIDRVVARQEGLA